MRSAISFFVRSDIGLIAVFAVAVAITVVASWLYFDTSHTPSNCPEWSITSGSVRMQACPDK